MGWAKGNGLFNSVVAAACAGVSREVIQNSFTMAAFSDRLYVSAPTYDYSQYTNEYEMPTDSIWMLNMINHVIRMPILDDGVKLNDRLWVRVLFTDWSNGIVNNYILYANGLSPGLELLNDAIGVDQCGDVPLEDIPPCIANPLLMRRVRGRDTDNVRMQNNRVVWMNDLYITAQELNEITRRDKWEFNEQGEKLCRELVNLLSQQDSTEVSD